MGKCVCIPVWMEGYFGRVQWVTPVGWEEGGVPVNSGHPAVCWVSSCACHGVCSALAREASGQECACAVVGIESGGWGGEVGGSQGW